MKSKPIIRTLVLVAMAATVACLGQVPASAANGTLQGRVTDLDTGAAVSNVLISAFGSGTYSGRTNSSGNYSISLPPDNYHVLADGSGYAQAHQYGVGVGDGGTTNFNFAITKRQGSISGRVIDSAGNPVAGDILADSTEGNGFGNSQMDSNGSFTITRLPPMAYWVHAFPSNPAQPTTAISGVRVNDGQTTNVTIQLNSGAARIVGRVTYSDGSPVANAALYIDSGQTASAWSGQTDSNGYYVSSHLPLARYNVHTSGVFGWPNQVVWNIDPFQGQDTIINIQLTNQVGGIAGFIKDINGQAIAGAAVDAFSTSSNGPWGWQSVTSGSDGWYHLNMLVPSDRYQIFVSVPGRPQQRADFVPVTAGKTTQPLNFIYTFSGRGVASNPLGGFYVLAGDGTVFAMDGAPHYGAPAFGRDIARGIAAMPDGKGYMVLDGHGGVHKFGSAASGATANLANPYFGWDIARGLAISPTGKGFGVLDGFGGFHSVGDAPQPGTGRLPYWRNWDIARGVVISPSGNGLYILDGYGGVHTTGDGVPRANPYFGVDIARGVIVTPDNGGYALLDGLGGIHTMGNAPGPFGGSWLGHDGWRGMTFHSGRYQLVRHDGLTARF